MKATHIGKRDIFAKTTPPEKAEKEKTEKAVRVQAKKYASVENKLTVILPPGQVAFLDQLALNIRGKTGAKIRRTEIIRALVGALQESHLEVTEATSEEDLVERIKAHLKISSSRESEKASS